MPSPVKMPWLCIVSLTCSSTGDTCVPVARATAAEAARVGGGGRSYGWRRPLELTMTVALVSRPLIADLITFFVQHLHLQWLSSHPFTGKRFTLECFVIKERKKI